MDWLETVIFHLLEFAKGPLGIFMISAVSNSLPFISIPYLAIVASYSTIYVDLPGRILLTTSSAAGATVGKILIYFLGSAVRIKLHESSKKNLALFKKIAKKSLFIATALFAATPLPDDILYIPLGLMKYPLPLYVISVFAGKLALTSIVVLYAGIVVEVAYNSLYLIPLLLVITVILSYLILRIDWSDVINATYSEGPVKGLMEIINQSAAILRDLVKRFTKIRP